ncbi:hypothetical protein [Labrys neptuniae]|uniref:Transcriptional regulator n=1 Tax=Labrys neptuniae TaxID=376174 RepID=A0ABV3PIK9_9HYPH
MAKDILRSPDSRKRALVDEAFGDEAKAWQLAIYLSSRMFSLPQAEFARLMRLTPAYVSLAIRGVEVMRAGEAFDHLMFHSETLVAHSFCWAMMIKGQLARRVADPICCELSLLKAHNRLVVKLGSAFAVDAVVAPDHRRATILARLLALQDALSPDEPDTKDITPR